MKILFIRYVWILLLFASCGSIQKTEKKITTLSFKKNLSKICLSGEGKGRMKAGRQKVYFQFEAINNLSKKEWALAFSIPLYGEEILRIDWSRPDTFKAKGKILKRIFKNMGKKKTLMIASFKSIIAFLNLHHELALGQNIQCDEGCSYLGHNIVNKKNFENEFEFIIKSSDAHGPTLKVKAFDTSSFHHRLELLAYTHKPLLSLSLFYGQCTDKIPIAHKNNASK